MTPAETVTILHQFNEWRRSDEDIPQFDPRKIGKAIDTAIEIIERAESDLATAEQDSRQKQARIERLTEALSSLLNDALQAQIERMGRQEPVAEWLPLDSGEDTRRD